METSIDISNAAARIFGMGDVPVEQVHLLFNEIMSVAAKYGVDMNIVRTSGVITEEQQRHD